jgi:DNA-binding transcriptional regulator YiaG
MNANATKAAKRPFGAERPFPWRCRHCGKVEVVPGVVKYDAEVRHDGRSHAFTISKLKAPVCGACKEMVVTGEVDQQITDALRAHLHLLTPEEIAAALTRLGITQKEAAERLGIAEETLSRWVNGLQIQTRAMDNWLRAFFGFPAVRDAFCGQRQDPLLGTTDVSALIGRE